MWLHIKTLQIAMLNLQPLCLITVSRPTFRMILYVPYAVMDTTRIPEIFVPVVALTIVSNAPIFQRAPYARKSTLSILVTLPLPNAKVTL